MSANQPEKFLTASREVQTNQNHLHPKLLVMVERHLTHAYRATVASHNRRAYDRLAERRLWDTRPLILDSYCGTGRSTASIAQQNPGHLVVGIDKSAARLAKHGDMQGDNYLLLRAECEPIWQLLASEGARLAKHYLLYPNPWPKSRHLQRRIHGHPNFPQLIALGGYIELRSNWQLYVEEFGAAMHFAGHPGLVCALPSDEEPLSLFEKKYQRSGHTLWCYRCSIEP